MNKGESMSKVCVGVDIGGTSVKIGVFTSEGKVLDKWEIPTRKISAGKYILEDIVISLNARLRKSKISKEDIMGIGIGVPGPVTEEGVVLKCANLGWDVFNVADKVRKLTGIENVKVGNDANVAALGEIWKGGGRGYKSIVMVTLGTGVGGGVVIDGKIITGSRGAAGEIGHITVEYDERNTCGCGKRGCLEQFASATGIVNEAKRKLNIATKPSKLRGIEYPSAKIIFDIAKEGDELANELVDQLGRYLGIALSHVAAVVDPEAFVIGGGVSRAGQMLIEIIKNHYEKNVMFALQNKEFKLAELGNDAGIFGSAKMVLD
jgi:glucokinase